MQNKLLFLFNLQDFKCTILTFMKRSWGERFRRPPWRAGMRRGKQRLLCSSLCWGGGLQRHSKQLRTHFGPNLNPLSHSVIPPYNLMLRTCVRLCLTLCATLHYPAAKFSPPPPPPSHHHQPAVRALFVRLESKHSAPTASFPTWLECFPVSLSLFSTN